MRTAREAAELQTAIRQLRRDGADEIGFVPTMGALHAGHLSLVEIARRRGAKVVVSIFVNPTQFGPTEDLARYPRDEAGDLAKAQTCGVDLAFCPDAAAMYGPGAQTFVTVRELEQPMCGERRPGHFAGVATIVTKLFNLTRPHLAFFGEKDFQQLAIIRRLVRDLDFGIEVVGLPIVREPDGLAMSSRNVYLSPDHRRQALALSRGLAAAAARVAAGERDPAALLAAARAPFAEAPDARLDYLELRGADDLAPLTQLDRRAVMAVAAFVGSTRLIDNRVLAP